MQKLALSIPEAAEAIGISDRKLRDLVCVKGFPVVRLGGRVLIPVDPLRDWLREKAESGEMIQ
ncbi:helix-turn-helix domain-containing protein [Clostridiaceae bacterium OttesenSCG-928-D20]|nr:helix-turn-helix domain-containing protein [Clostridiaceae bacterium OttesenSCG-928-D20]